MSDKSLDYANLIIFAHPVLRRACELRALLERQNLMNHYGEDGSVLDAEIDKALNLFFHVWIDHTAGIDLT